ncbi:uncharacterized protein K02A2.6-like [Teleopsis dalmanni]|uniref:uncharacterized protein K02A2.6-like n=1 Tax=Teleopsis dalmanni TaxID=139649 RepID=UPI0018CD3C20|nr:uncharacterized protein K02A2.6-like [Teleopsis dalmanni]
MRTFVKGYIANCVECYFNRKPGGRSECELHIDELEPLKPFRILHPDHLGPFIRSKKENTHILVLVDRFTKYVIIKAVRNTKTQPIINALNELSSIFGLPVKIITDRGTSFNSKVFFDYCKLNEIKHVKTAVRTPRVNGQVKRLNQSILSFLKTAKFDDKNLDEELRSLQWMLNT